MIIAHRGESFDAPENTLAAIELAWERGNRLVELDVHCTRDGHFVLCHDPDTHRICGERLIVAEQTLERLSRLDVGRWKGRRWAGQRVATLPQVFATTPPDGRLFIEVKCPADAVPALMDVIHHNPHVTPGQCVITSFKAEVIARVKQTAPGLKAYWLVHLRELAEGGWWPGLDQLIDLARAIHADGVDLPAPCVDAQTVRRLNSAGLKVYAWRSRDDPAVARALLAAGVEGFTTNRAAWMRRQLSPSLIAQEMQPSI